MADWSKDPNYKPVARHPSGLTRKERARILRSQKVSTSAIAKALGISRWTVNRHARQLGGSRDHDGSWWRFTAGDLERALRRKSRIG